MILYVELTNNINTDPESLSTLIKSRIPRHNELKNKSKKTKFPIVL